MDQVPVGNRRNRADVSCGRGTRSRRVQTEVEGGRGRRSRELPVSISGMRRCRILRAGLGADAELARGSGYVDDLGGGRLRGDARIRLQQDRVWKDGSRRLFRHRSRNCRGARTHLCAFHLQDPGVSCRRRSRVFHSALADAALFQVIWKPAL